MSTLMFSKTLSTSISFNLFDLLFNLHKCCSWLLIQNVELVLGIAGQLQEIELSAFVEFTEYILVFLELDTHIIHEPYLLRVEVVGPLR